MNRKGENTMATNYDKKGARSKKSTKLALGASRAFTAIPGQDPPIIIKPGSLKIIVGSKPTTPHKNRLKETPISANDYEYGHNQSYTVQDVTIFDVDSGIETSLSLPD